MDIFFCDECASRVTGADLQRGFGIRKGDVVVCGSCVEEGRGADRLAKAGAAEKQAPASKPALVGAGALDEARDRARTSPEDEEPTAEPAEGFFEDVSPEDDTDPLNNAIEHASGSSQSGGLRAMASGMSALSESEAAQEADEDDLEDTGAAEAAATEEAEPDPAASAELADDIASAEESAAAAESDDAGSESGDVEEAELELGADDAEASDGATQPAEEDAAAADEDGDELAPAELDLGEADDEGTGKAETEEVPAYKSARSKSDRSKPTTSARRKSRDSAKKKRGSDRRSTTTKTKSSRSSQQKTTGRGSTRTSQAASGSRRSGGKTTSTRRLPAKKNNNALIYGISAVTIGILLVAIVVVASKGGGDGGNGSGPTTIDYVGDLRAEAQAAKRQAVEALQQPHNRGELQAALRSMRQVMENVYDLEAEAKRQGRTEAEIGRILDRQVRLDELMTLNRSLRDAISVLDGREL